MIKKAEMIVEQFDNGIAIRCSSPDAESNKIALRDSEAYFIGEEVWQEIYDIMDKEGTAKVKVKLEFESIND